MRFLQQPIFFAIVLTATAGFSQTPPPSITAVKPMAAEAHPSFAVAVIKPHDPNAPPGIFTAIQEQLGLKLDRVKASADFLVIEHVEKPSED